MGDHIVDGEFQSDKYPTCPRGKVPLSVHDVTAQDLLWKYAQRRRVVDAGFSEDLETCLRAAGYAPSLSTDDGFATRDIVITAAVEVLSIELYERLADRVVELFGARYHGTSADKQK